MAGLDLGRGLPFSLTGPASAGSGTYTDLEGVYDFSVGGVPFLSGISREDPVLIKSAEFRKQQIDQSAEPGEQSLTGWWARSQLSMHGGAGLKYSDPALDESAPIRFEDSRGCDIWTPGQVTLLPEAPEAYAVPATDKIVMVGARIAGVDLVVFGSGTTLRYVTDAFANGTLTTTSGAAPTTAWQAIATDGACFFLANGEGVWELRWTSFPGTYTYRQIWDWGVTTTATVALGWAMGRLMAGVDTKLYELVLTGGALPEALPTNAVYTSLTPDWRWTSITAGPEAIYASGYAGNRGSILAATLDTSGALPTLTGATEVAQLPTGETPRCIRAYLGTLMVIGSNKGVRVADIESGGSIAYGPLIETEASVEDMSSFDRFAYVAASSSTEGAGLIRVDLSLLHEVSGRYAWAHDLQIPDVGTVTAVATVGETSRMAFAVPGEGVYLASATRLVESGWVQTAATRFNTLWPKLFKRLSVRALVYGSIVVETVDYTGVMTTIATIGENTDLTADLAINVPDTPQEQLALKFTLNRASLTVGPTLRGYILKALPGGPRQYEYVLPLLCFDHEKGQDGQEIGYPGFGWERLHQVMGIASQGSVVMLTELNTGLSDLVTIEDVNFRQTAPSKQSDAAWGGVLNLTLRTLE
ncbi:hypothetical protein [Actinocorallia libanotica]|uniref:Tail protein n=1 Tax=Actinocorallia libanotica TaxID=46162 RepID=A0ABN1Q2Y3_9ACTN